MRDWPEIQVTSDAVLWDGEVVIHLDDRDDPDVEVLEIGLRTGAAIREARSIKLLARAEVSKRVLEDLQRLVREAEGASAIAVTLEPGLLKALLSICADERIERERAQLGDGIWRERCERAVADGRDARDRALARVSALECALEDVRAYALEMEEELWGRDASGYDAQGQRKPYTPSDRLKGGR